MFEIYIPEGVVKKNVIISCIAIFVVFAGQVRAEDVTYNGNAELELKYIKALDKTGQPTPRYDQACKDQLSASGAIVRLGMKIRTSYIIAANAREKAVSRFDSQVILLYPMGIAGAYDFMNSVAGYHVYFHLDKNRRHPISSFLLLNPREEYNCHISSSQAGIVVPVPYSIRSQKK
ncbi:hypothetical protein [Burkholderia lata]|uniref:hypothetical protein n=1 Tax=Burkholderia lata (strain ATCC 17760 / DSM 23089 / LMG 22485 / NCIMB 9086 / R18194 / 383) TaxID=482957 RepID=UPI001581A4E4|nr:hypothetical protein [Burkholderia lata]